MPHYVWYEKFRPKVLRDVVLPEEHIVRFQQYIDDGNFPHLLFLGPPGSGKTTMAKILTGSIQTQVLELNASSQDRGIDTIRGKVSEFARSQPRPNTLKVVFFDEADKLTADAQTALRNTIEATAESCRFIFTANFGDKIIAPLKSRCTIYPFEAFPKRNLYKYLSSILIEEGITYERHEILALMERYYPDIRTIVNNLQAGSIGGTFRSKQANLSGNIDISALLTLLSNGEIKRMREMWVGSTDFTWFYRWLFNQVVPSQFLDEHVAEAGLIVAQYMYQDSTVMDREINFTACCLELMNGPLAITRVIW